MGVAMCILNTLPSDSDGGKEPHFDNHCKGQKMFSVKDQKVCIIGFVGHAVSDALLCICSTKAAIDNTQNTWACKTIY